MKWVWLTGHLVANQFATLNITDAGKQWTNLLLGHCLWQIVDNQISFWLILAIAAAILLSIQCHIRFGFCVYKICFVYFSFPPTLQKKNVVLISYNWCTKKPNHYWMKCFRFRWFRFQWPYKKMSFYFNTDIFTSTLFRPTKWNEFEKIDRSFITICVSWIIYRSNDFRFALTCVHTKAKLMLLRLQFVLFFEKICKIKGKIFYLLFYFYWFHRRKLHRGIYLSR